MKSLIHAALGVSILLLMSSIGIVGFLPTKFAFAATTITTSSSQFYGSSLERVLITDTAKTNAGDSILPHIDVKRGAGTLASIDPTIFNIGTSGTFEFYLTTSNAPFNPAHPNFGFGNSSSAFVGRINSSPVGDENDFLVSLSSGDFLKDGDSIVVSYGGNNLTILFAKSNVVASVDRTIAGDGDFVTLTLNDQNANIDPTNVDMITAASSILTADVGALN